MDSSIVTRVSTDNLNNSWQYKLRKCIRQSLEYQCQRTHREVINVRNVAFVVIVNCVLLQFLIDHRCLHESIHSNEGLTEGLFTVSNFVVLSLTSPLTILTLIHQATLLFLCQSKSFICSSQSHIIENIELNIVIESIQHSFIIIGFAKIKLCQN